MLRKIAVALIVPLLLAGCGGSGTSGASSSGKTVPAAETAASNSTLVLRIPSQLDSLDPAILARPFTTAIAWDIYDGLVRFQPGTNKIIPDLATSWDVSPDGKTYTFHLRHGVQWQDGFGPFTASDVVYSFKRVQNPATKSPYAHDMDLIQSVTAPDPYTVKLVLKEPYPDFLGTSLAFRAGQIVNQKAIEKYGAQYAFHPVGTGPYEFKSYVPGDQLTLVRNDNYFGGKPAIKTVEFKVIPQDSVAALALQKGEVNWAYITSGVAMQQLAADKSLKTTTYPGYRVLWISLNTNYGVTKNPLIRQALNYATDKEALVKGVLNGEGVPDLSPMNPHTFGYSTSFSQYTYDVAKAKQLVSQAGYPNGVNLTIYTITETQFPQINALLQQQWAQAGIHATFKALTRPVLDAKEQSGQYNGIGFALTRLEPDQYLYSFLDSHNAPGTDYSFYGGANSIIEQARVTANPQKAQQLWNEANTQVGKDAPIVPLVVGDEMLVTTSNVVGAQEGYMDMMDLRGVSLK